MYTRNGRVGVRYKVSTKHVYLNAAIVLHIKASNLAHVWVLICTQRGQHLATFSNFQVEVITMPLQITAINRLSTPTQIT